MENIKEYYRVFSQHIYNDFEPSLYFNELLLLDAFPKDYPYNMLFILKDIDQEPKHHPEGNVWNHTMQVLDNAANYKKYSSNVSALMWAALLHDIGKGTTTKVRKGRITAYNHDLEGEKLVKDFLEVLTSDTVFINKVCKLVRWHMQPFFVYKELPFSDKKSLVKETSITEIAILSLCDRLGRGELSKNKRREEYSVIITFLQKCYKSEKDSKELETIEGLMHSLNEEIDGLF